MTTDKWIQIAQAKADELSRKEEEKNQRKRKKEEKQRSMLNKETIETKKNKKCKKKTDTDIVPINDDLSSRLTPPKEMINTIKDIAKTKEETKKWDLGSYVIVQYDRMYYPAKILKIDENDIKCSAMEKSGLHWKWPDVADITWYPSDKVIEVITEPEKVNSRGLFSVRQMCDYS